MAGTEMDMVGVSTWLIPLTMLRMFYRKFSMKEPLKTRVKWLDL